MQAPFFFIEAIPQAGASVALNEEASRHVLQVLRMGIGEEILLTDGKGSLGHCAISEAQKKKCTVAVEKIESRPPGTRKMSIAMSLLKNTNRFEWFLEKSTELGITEIIPAVCERTEKQHFRPERMQHILVSALLQSRQAWLPILQEPTHLNTIIHQSSHAQKFIAHCAGEPRISLMDAVNPATRSQIILVGPEGDFTRSEIDFAMRNHFVPVALGANRLRSETAGIAAAVMLAGQ